jgi:hypothetical protein
VRTLLVIPQAAANTRKVITKGSASDGIVPLTSQLNGTSTGGTPGGGGPVTNVIHSAGLQNLNFLGPYELGDSVMANYAFDLLNAAKSGADLQH